MRQMAVSGLWMILLAGLLSGCAVRNRCQSGGCYDQGPAMEPAFRGVQRGTISPDLSELESSDTVDSTRSAALDPPQYRAFDADECKCLAAANATVANLLEQEGWISQPCDSFLNGCTSESSEAKTRLMAFRAADERNRAAAAALELFYLLAEAEYNRDSLRRGLDEVGQALDNLWKLQARGLHVDLDDGELKKKQADMLDRQAELALSLAKLNGQLRQLLGVDKNDTTPIWPETDLKVNVEAIDVESAVVQGLSMRPDLGALYAATEMLDGKSWRSARGMLTGVDAMLGASASSLHSICKLLGGARDNERSTRYGQLCSLIAQRQRYATEEIRQAALTVQTRLVQVDLARKTLEDRKQRLDELQKKWGDPKITAFDLSAARLDVIQADSDLVHQVVAWQIARVKLREAQGMLAFECGHTTSPSPCETHLDELVFDEQIIPAEPPLLQSPAILKPTPTEPAPTEPSPTDQPESLTPDQEADGQPDQTESAPDANGDVFEAHDPLPPGESPPGKDIPGSDDSGDENAEPALTDPSLMSQPESLAPDANGDAFEAHDPLPSNKPGS